MVKNFIRSFETVTQRWEKFNSQLHNIVNKISPEPQIFGKYEVVEPQKVSLVKGVPLHINTPPYIRVQESPSAPNDIQIKSKHEIEAMKLSCSLARELLNHLKNVIRIGVTTDELDYVAHEFVLQKGAYPSPLGYNGFPKSICTSVNNIIVHGIPDDRPLKNGDIISVDVTVFKNGFHGDCAETFLVGRVDADGRKLVDGARELLYAGIQCCGPRVPFYRIASEIQNRAKQLKLTVIPSVNGHGIGKWFHESPCIWHKIICDDDVNDEFVMQPGMVFTIEPAIGEGTEEAEILNDGWTLATADNSRAAQFEHTVAITNTGYEILTK